MHDFHLARIPPAGPGASARFRVSPPFARTWMDTTITEVRHPHLISERGSCGRSNRVPVAAAWELEEGLGGLTTVRLTFWTEPGHIDRVRELFGSKGWYRRKWKQALRRLKGELESEQPLPRVSVGGADRIPAAGPV